MVCCMAWHLCVPKEGILPSGNVTRHVGTVWRMCLDMCMDIYMEICIARRIDRYTPIGMCMGMCMRTEVHIGVLEIPA